MTFVSSLVVQLRWARVQIKRLQGTMHSIFPSGPPIAITDSAKHGWSPQERASWRQSSITG